MPTQTPIIPFSKPSHKQNNPNSCQKTQNPRQLKLFLGNQMILKSISK